MRVRWTPEALADLERVVAFLRPVAPIAARHTLQRLRASALMLRDQPCLGRLIGRLGGRDIRRIRSGSYEVRYMLAADSIVILRLWHTREDR
jgi:plasmid stabilization system protein ParE